MFYKIIKKIKYKFFYSKSLFTKVKMGKKSIFESPRRIIGNKYITINNNVYLGKNIRLCCYDFYCGCQYYPSIFIDDGVVIKDNVSILSAGNIYIGKDTMIAGNVFISNENHGINPEFQSYKEQPLYVKDVIIKENCWIGEKTIILPGVTIEKNSIIGAGSVVTKNIPEYSIAVGNPAKVIKKWDFQIKKWVSVN